MLQPSDVITEFLPGNIFRKLVENICEIIQICPDVGAVVFQGVVSQTTEGDHLPERI